MYARLCNYRHSGHDRSYRREPTYRLGGRTGEPIGVGLLVDAVTDLARFRVVLDVSEEPSHVSMGRSTPEALADQEREAFARRIAVVRALLEAVVQQMPSGIIIAEAPSGRLILGNEQTERIWWRPLMPSPDVEAYRDYRGFHPDGRPYDPEEWPLARALKGETVRDETIQIERGNGTMGVIDVSAVPIRDACGAVVAGAVSFDGVTERYRVQASVRFLAEASHILASSLDYETRSRAWPAWPCLGWPTGAPWTCWMRIGRYGG